VTVQFSLTHVEASFPTETGIRGWMDPSFGRQAMRRSRDSSEFGFESQKIVA